MLWWQNIFLLYNCDVSDVLITVIWVCACCLLFVLYIGKMNTLLVIFEKLTQILKQKKMIRNNKLIVFIFNPANELEMIIFFFSPWLQLSHRADIFKMLNLISPEKNQSRYCCLMYSMWQTGIRDVKLIIYAFSWFVRAVLGMHAVSLSTCPAAPACSPQWLKL